MRREEEADRGGLAGAVHTFRPAGKAGRRHTGAAAEAARALGLHARNRESGGVRRNRERRWCFMVWLPT